MSYEWLNEAQENIIINEAIDWLDALYEWGDIDEYDYEEILETASLEELAEMVDYFEEDYYEEAFPNTSTGSLTDLPGQIASGVRNWNEKRKYNKLGKFGKAKWHASKAANYVGGKAKGAAGYAGGKAMQGGKWAKAHPWKTAAGAALATGAVVGARAAVKGYKAQKIKNQCLRSSNSASQFAKCVQGKGAFTNKSEDALAKMYKVGKSKMKK